MSQTIPLTALAQYPAHLSSSLGDDDDECLVALALRSIGRFDVDHRATLVDAAVVDLKLWSAPPKALEAVETLRATGSYAVVTGQQAGIATGPLYTVYKALGALREAHELGMRHPDHRFVAVFWIEGDDHDFDEARRFAVIDREGMTRSLAYDDADPRPLHVGERAIDAAAFEKLIDDLRETLITTEFTDEMISLLEASYLAEDSTMASGFARSLYAILGDVPLVVVSSRNPRMKWLAKEAFEREAREPEVLHRAISERTDELRALGRSTPITPKAGALFMTHDGERRSLDLDGEDYALRDSAVRMTREEIAELARRNPERLSPNVMLRPIVQDAILPTAVYVGGPSELAYLEQVAPAYAAFKQQPPSFVPRPFVLLMEPKAKRALEGAGLAIERMLDESFSASAYVIDEAFEKEIEAAKGRAIEGVRQALTSLETITGKVDPTLEKALGATTAGAEKSVEDFAKRLRSALKRKSQTEIDRIESARELLLPAHSLQERTLSPLYYINKYGLDRFRAALEKVEICRGVLQIIEI